jgi:hypothetical protein
MLDFKCKYLTWKTKIKVGENIPRKEKEKKERKKNLLKNIVALVY